jgi:hypothetical protein
VKGFEMIRVNSNDTSRTIGTIGKIKMMSRAIARIIIIIFDVKVVEATNGS